MNRDQFEALARKHRLLPPRDGAVQLTGTGEEIRTALEAFCADVERATREWAKGRCKDIGAEHWHRGTSKARGELLAVCDECADAIMTRQIEPGSTNASEVNHG